MKIKAIALIDQEYGYQRYKAGDDMLVARDDFRVLEALGRIARYVEKPKAQTKDIKAEQKDEPKKNRKRGTYKTRDMKAE